MRRSRGFFISAMSWFASIIKRKRFTLLSVFSWLNFAGLLLVWAAEHFFSGMNDIAFLLAEAPQIIFLPFSVLLLVRAFWQRKRWMSAMNASAAVFALFALLGLHLPHPTPIASGTPLRVMTFNVEKWSHGTPRVAQTIRQYHPDIVCLEEAGDYSWVQPAHAPEALKALLPGYECIRRGEIIIATRLPMESRQTALLPPGPDSRPALEVTVLVHGKPVTIIAVHLIPMQLDLHWHDSVRTWPDYVQQCRWQRRVQVTHLLQALAVIKTPLVLCGDFNLSPASSDCRRLAAVYPDAFDLAGFGFGNTETSTLPLRRIDHILTSTALRPISAFVPDVHASDHRPLIADLIL